MGKTLIQIGILLVVVGCIMHFGGKIFPFGHLPGDIHWEGEHSSFHFPIVTCIVVSIVLNIILRLFR